MKYITSILLIFISTFSFSQFTVKSDGNVVNSNAIFTFTETNETLALQITNSSPSTRRYYVKVEDIINAFGFDFQICLLTCYSGASVGDIFPTSGDDPYTLNSNQTSSTEDFHFIKGDTEFGDFPMDYVLKIYETDTNGNILGTPFFFTYRYNPNGTASNVDNIVENIQIYPTITNDIVNVISDVKLTGRIFDFQGRLLKEQFLEKGTSILNLSQLSTQAYILIFEDIQGNKLTQKIIKQ